MAVADRIAKVSKVIMEVTSRQEVIMVAVGASVEVSVASAVRAVVAVGEVEVDAEVVVVVDMEEDLSGESRGAEVSVFFII